MDPVAAAEAIYSGKSDQILQGLTFLRQSDASAMRQVVMAAVKANHVKVGGDVIWKTPTDGSDPTAGGNPKTMAWMIKTGWRTTVSIAFSDLNKLSEAELAELAGLLTKSQEDLTVIAFPKV